jgi:hypothetical protein
MKIPTHGALRFANDTLRRVNCFVEISLASPRPHVPVSLHPDLRQEAIAQSNCDRLGGTGGSHSATTVGLDPLEAIAIGQYVLNNSPHGGGV